MGCTKLPITGLESASPYELFSYQLGSAVGFSEVALLAYDFSGNSLVCSQLRDHEHSSLAALHVELEIWGRGWLASVLRSARAEPISAASTG